MVEPDVAFLKAGFYGPQGSGKTRTAIELALGMIRWIQERGGAIRPAIVFNDTEGGAGYVQPICAAAGVKLYVDRTRAFGDLLTNLRRAPDVADIVITDSVTHYWRELVDAYNTRKRLKFLRIQDWGPLKEQWARYTTAFLDSPLHQIMCGRAANVFEDAEEEDDNRPGETAWKAHRVGTKMAAEGETGYEPGLLIEMTRVLFDEGGQYRRVATVLKDRFDLLDGKAFTFGSGDKPGFVFECFRPHVEKLKLGGVQGTMAATDSQALFDDDGGQHGPSFAQIARQREIALEELEGIVAQFVPGSSPKERQLKMHVFQATFGTTSWSALQSWPPQQLRDVRGLLGHLLDYALQHDPPDTHPQAVADWLAAERDVYLVAQADARKAAQAAEQQPVLFGDGDGRPPTS